jgi:hypothetical protein
LIELVGNHIRPGDDEKKQEHEKKETDVGYSMLLKPPPHYPPIARVLFDSVREQRLTVGDASNLIGHLLYLFTTKITKDTKVSGCDESSPTL